jgi:hypothetical protein
MPTNLPPEYFKIEERFREAQTADEKIALLEQLMSVVPKHKGTDHLRADLRRRLSKLRTSGGGQKGGSRQLSAYAIDREGAGQVVLFGPPNTGKSALLAAVSNAKPEVAEFPFSTWEPTPGMMVVENVQIQLIDLPPLNPDFVEMQMINLIRHTDVLAITADLQAFPIEQIEDSLRFLADYRIAPIGHHEASETEAPWTLLPTIIIANKADRDEDAEDVAVLRELLDLDLPIVGVSAKTGRGLEALGWALFDILRIIRVYSKPPGQQVDHSAPFVCKRGTTVEEFAAKVHRDIAANLKSARVWGSALHDGQMVARDHVLQDEDIVELRS